MESRRLLVIGGGIAGLSAAYTAACRLEGHGEVVLVERDRVLGGKAQSHRENGWMVEEGPNGFLDNDAGFRDLIRDLDLEAECVPAAKSAKKRFILYDGKLCEVGPNPIKMLSSGILGFGALLRVLREPRIQGVRRGEGSADTGSAHGRAAPDESVDGFVRRRFGPQIAERFAAPMVLGIFAGDSRQLSMPAAFPQVTEMEERHGSVLRGMKAAKKERRKQARHGAVQPAGGLHTFQSGMHMVARRLEERLASMPHVTLRPETTVTSVRRAGERYHVVMSASGSGSASPGTEPTSLDCDSIIFAVEAWAMADFIGTLAPEAVSALQGIEGPPVTVVGLGYDPQTSKYIPNGFGALISRGEGPRILGCLWESRIYPQRSPDGHVLVRAMLGGAVDPEAGRLDDDAALALVQREVAQLLGLEGAPIYSHVKRWSKAIPQYTLGHGERVAAVERAMTARPGLYLAGNSFHGVAFAKSATSGVDAGTNAADWLLSREASAREAALTK